MGEAIVAMDIVCIGTRGQWVPREKLIPAFAISSVGPRAPVRPASKAPPALGSSRLGLQWADVGVIWGTLGGIAHGIC